MFESRDARRGRTRPRASRVRVLPVRVLPEGAPSKGSCVGLPRVLSLGLLIWGLTACSAGERSEPASDATAERPLRVISLAPSLTRMLIEVGRADVVIGVDRFSSGLPEVAHASVLGGLFSPDMERLVELAPTLVLGVESAQQRAFFDQVRARGTQVETFRLHTLAQVLEAFVRVGQLVGAPDRGAALAQRVQDELDQVAAATRGRDRVRVALVVDREPLFVVGGGSFASALIEIAGGENVFGDLAAAYPRVSIESLADRRPDVLLETVDPTPEAAEAVRTYWAQFSFVPRVEPLPRGDVVLPSPALGAAARLLRAAIHPERTGE